MAHQKEDSEQGAQSDTGRPEGAKATAPERKLRHCAWEEALESFLERFPFAPVEMSPDVHGGVPLVAGSEVPVSTVLWMLSVGYRVENILKEYPSLERKQVLNALAFAADLLDG